MRRSSGAERRSAVVGHLVLDIGGTWIKGALVPDGAVLPEFFLSGSAEVRRRPAPRDGGGFLPILRSLVADCAQGASLSAVVVSTAGVVHSSGESVTLCADHLAFLRTPAWRGDLESALGCPVRLLNDAEAFLLGTAVMGLVPRAGTFCCLVVGTGLGCALAKDARFWRPQRTVPLLGSIRIAGTSFDALASASALAAHDPDHDLVKCLTEPAHRAARDAYFSRMAEIVISAAILYGADRFLLGGGLCAAAEAAGVDAAALVREQWRDLPPELQSWPDIAMAPGGNAVQLIGAAGLAQGSAERQLRASALGYPSIVTEGILPGTDGLHARTPREILEVLCRTENAAGRALEDSLDAIAAVADHVIRNWAAGGRVIYVGAGTSGRVAAMDAVEIPCTFGCPPDRVVAVIAGGLEESALSIERDGEEDHSAVPDLMLLQPDPRDTVVGISASGSAYFVRSALAYARQCGAATVLIQAGEAPGPDAWDWTIPLRSGCEAVAGSTRMKAGTATKKVLNFLTTAVMAKCGKLRGPFMIDMECLNAKLMARAENILGQLFALTPGEARTLLERNGRRLSQAIAAHEASLNPSPTTISQ